MSFRSAKLELVSFLPELNAVQAGVRLNRAYQHLLAANPWSFLRKEAIVTTVAPYTTGTVTVTTGSTTVTGGSTVWTTGMASRFIRFADQMELYTIASVDAVLQTLTLDQAYGGSDLTADNYSIFQHHYTKPTDCKDIIGIRRALNMPERGVEYLNTLDPDRESTGEPLYWANYSDDTLEIWPVPDAVYVLRLYYMQSVSDVSTETGTFLIPERIVITAAAIEGYRQAATNPERSQVYLQLLQATTQEFQGLWASAVEDDMRKLSLPDRTQVEGWDYPVSNAFWYSHDVSDPRGPWS